MAARFRRALEALVWSVLQDALSGDVAVVVLDALALESWLTVSHETGNYGAADRLVLGEVGIGLDRFTVLLDEAVADALVLGKAEEFELLTLHGSQRKAFGHFETVDSDLPNVLQF